MTVYKITRSGNAIGDKLLASLFVHILNDNKIPAILNLSKEINFIDCDYSYKEDNEFIDYDFAYTNKQIEDESLIKSAIDLFKNKFNINKEIINTRKYIPIKFQENDSVPSVDVVIVTKSSAWAPVRDWPYFEELKNELDKNNISWIDATEQGITDSLFLNYVEKSKVFLTLETGPSHMASQLVNKNNSLVIQSGYCLNSFWNMYNYDYINYNIECQKCFFKKTICNNAHKCMKNISVDTVLTKIKEKINKRVNTMNICVVGWYLYEDLYKTLKEVDKTHKVTIISHKNESEKLQSFNIDYIIKENVGLEFGAYDYFLKKYWDKESDVLFMHDDVHITDISVFDKIEKDMNKKKIDQAYLFKNKEEENNNGGKHGRSIFMSAKLLNFMLNYKFKTEESEDHVDNHHNIGTILKGTGEYSGFWYDPNNYGHTTGKPPIGVRHYNEMIYTFHRTMGRIRDKRYGNEPMNVVNRVYYPEIDCARRGVFRKEVSKK